MRSLHRVGAQSGTATDCKVFAIVGLHVIGFFARGFVTAAGLLLVHPKEGRSGVRLVDRGVREWTFVKSWHTGQFLWQ